MGMPSSPNKRPRPSVDEDHDNDPSVFSQNTPVLDQTTPKAIQYRNRFNLEKHQDESPPPSPSEASSSSLTSKLLGIAPFTDLSCRASFHLGHSPICCNSDTGMISSYSDFKQTLQPTRSNSPTAQITHGFKPKNAPSPMVNLCAIARPQEESREQIAIEDYCKHRSEDTINHTDWGNLNKDPIAISVETEKHGEGGTKAIH
ncbi:hypothetical protein F66182_4951 [Fusarium sp. NRRL 66182]|nr:hypothetical protein F66182_4951 [Fusarium sp. NRRL 66182]